MISAMIAMPSRVRNERRAGLCAVALCALLLGSGEARAYERATADDNPEIYLYWPIRNVTYLVNRRGCADVPLAETVGAIKRAFFSWASPSCTDLYFKLEGLTDVERTNLVKLGATKSDRKNVIVWREDAWPPPGVPAGAAPPEVAALTTLSYDATTGEIVDADMDLNGFDFFWTTTDDKTSAATDIQNVLTHEVGHLIGLDDLTSVASKDATMYGTTQQAELDKRDLAADDVQAVCAVYPYGKVTPVGPRQPPPHTGVQGAATGCQLLPAAPPAPAVLLALLAALGYILARVLVLQPLLRSGPGARRSRARAPHGARRAVLRADDARRPARAAAAGRAGRRAAARQLPRAELR